MTSIFISYSRKDIEIARKLTEAFKGQNLDFWIDWEGIPPTVDWWKEIEKGIEEADIFLFLISPDSAKSKVCKQEIETAVKNGKRLIPLVVQDIKGDEAPIELSHLNWIFIRENDDFETAFDKLMTAIKTDYEWVQIHRRLQVRALEWERGNKDNSLLLRGNDLQDAELQLATNSSKEPHPTDLQRDYVFKSRQATDRQRRIVTSIAILGVIALTGLAIFGFAQANIASSQAATAQAANTLAIANQNTAIANAEEAQRQANIALARQLAAQADSIQADSVYGPESSNQATAVLLAAQSMKMYPSAISAEILGNNTLPHVISTISYEGGVQSITFSPDGKFIASGSEDGTVRIWDASTGAEVHHMAHESVVHAVVFSPDGKLIASASDDKTVRVWSVETGEQTTIMLHESSVNVIAFSPDGKLIVSGSGDYFSEQGNAIVWETATGSEVTRMIHTTSVTAVAFNPNGKNVISAGEDTSVWDVMSGMEIIRKPFPAPVAFSPDGRYVASGGGYDRSLRVWDIESDDEIARINLNTFQIDVIAFSPNGKYVLSATNGSAHIWNIETENEVSQMSHDGAGFNYSAAFSPDGRYIVTGGCESSDDSCAPSTARLWEAETGRELARMVHEDGYLGGVSVAFSPDGTRIVSAGTNKIAVWEIAKGQEIVHVGFNNGGEHPSALSPDNRYIVFGTCSERNENEGNCVQYAAIVWDVENDLEIARMKHDSLVETIAFSPDGRYIVSGSWDNTVRVWEADTGKEVARMNHDGFVRIVNFSPDNRHVVSGSQDNTARVWDAFSGKEVARMLHDDQVTLVAFSPDGNYIISGGLDNTARLWDAFTGKEIASSDHQGSLETATFSPDGKFVLSTGNNIAIMWNAKTGDEIAHITYEGAAPSIATNSDGHYIVVALDGETARVWDVNTGRELINMNHEYGIRSADFSDDGRFVITVGCDSIGGARCTQSTIRVWEIETGEEVARMKSEGYSHNITSAAFSLDGKYIISEGDDFDSSVQVWIWQPDDLIKSACGRLNRNLTRSEWAQYISSAIPYQAVCENLPIEPEVTSTP